ncbi:RDD family protein [Corynebacterium stationis]|uniref:RDD family protein n=1 Tax=Corynebacterium stationis TaxID=1705 RepID=UPI003417A7BE
MRDVDTHEKLSIEQSIKRQWFRSILIVPGLGQTIGFIGAVVTQFTINPANEQRGAHDRWANAEVVKKK